MRKLVLSDCRKDVAEQLGVCETDEVVVRRINQAQERLLNRATDPVGSWQRFEICSSASRMCVVLPRQVRHVKAFWVCGVPGMVLSEWYEALGYWNGGVGMVEEGCGGDRLIDQGTVCSFDNVVSTDSDPRRIQVVATNPADAGKQITLRYVDAFGNRVYTEIDGVVQEGERLTLSTTGTLTASNVATNGLYHVVKAITNYPVRLYSYSTTLGVQVAQIALYEPSETVPIYRLVKVPGLGDGCGRNPHPADEVPSQLPTEPDEYCHRRPVTFAVRLQHVPCLVDNDPLVIGNLYALLLMIRGQELRRRNEIAQAQAVEMQAAAEIDGEIAAYLGDGMAPIIRTPDRDTWGGAVFNPIGGMWRWW